VEEASVSPLNDQRREKKKKKMEDGLLAAEPSENCEGVAASDSKATAIVVLSSIVALCASLSIGCSVSSTILSKHPIGLVIYILCIYFLPKQKKEE
jgi:hypothetical protein